MANTTLPVLEVWSLIKVFPRKFPSKAILSAVQAERLLLTSIAIPT